MRCVANVPNDAACDDGAVLQRRRDLRWRCSTAIAGSASWSTAMTASSCTARHLRYRQTDACDNVPSDSSCDDGLFCNGRRDLRRRPRLPGRDAGGSVTTG